MKGILVISHHTLAGAFVATSEMLVGKHDCVVSLGLEEGQTPEDFRQKVCTKLDDMKTKGYEQVIVLTDLFGGTPCNQVLQLLRDYDIHIVTGLNLPMLVQTILTNSDEIAADTAIETTMQEAKEGMLYVNQMFQNMEKEV